MENNYRKGAVRWKISKHVKAILRSFVIALTVNEILTFETFDFVKADQGH